MHQLHISEVGKTINFVVYGRTNIALAKGDNRFRHSGVVRSDKQEEYREKIMGGFFSKMWFHMTTSNDRYESFFYHKRHPGAKIRYYYLPGTDEQVIGLGYPPDHRWSLIKERVWHEISTVLCATRNPLQKLQYRRLMNELIHLEDSEVAEHIAYVLEARTLGEPKPYHISEDPYDHRFFRKTLPMIIWPRYENTTTPRRKYASYDISEKLIAA